VAELADAQDLKSWVPQGACGFDSRPRHYINNGQKSLGDLKTARLPRLDAVFGGTKAIDVTTASVERYKTLRLKDRSAPATVNRELAALKRMFRLGLRQGMVATMPYISMLAEHNVRKGFFELDQFQAILEHLPAEYHALFELASITGWRMKSELLSRQWRHVDFQRKGWLRIDPGEAKDASAGREFQFTTWMHEALERQRTFVSKVEKRTRSCASRMISVGRPSGISSEPACRGRPRWQ
jgi:integrase